MNGKMQWYIFKDGFKVCSHHISEYDLKRYVYRHGEVVESGTGSNKELAMRYFKALLGIVHESKANSVYISINGYDDPKEHIKQAISALESTRPDWTPCDEGLPDTSDDVFITYEYHGKRIASVGFMGHSGAWYIISDDDGNEARVNCIAWQPLPAPYRADDTTGKPDHIVDN